MSLHSFFFCFSNGLKMNPHTVILPIPYSHFAISFVLFGPTRASAHSVGGGVVASSHYLRLICYFDLCPLGPVSVSKFYFV